MFQFNMSLVYVVRARAGIHKASRSGLAIWVGQRVTWMVVRKARLPVTGVPSPRVMAASRSGSG